MFPQYTSVAAVYSGCAHDVEQPGTILCLLPCAVPVFGSPVTVVIGSSGTYLTAEP